MTSLETLGSTVSIDLHLPGSLRVESVAVFAPETASSGCLKSCSGKPNFTKARSDFLSKKRKQPSQQTNKNKTKKARQNKGTSTFCALRKTARALAMWASGTRKSLDSSLSLSHYHQLHRSIAWTLSRKLDGFVSFKTWEKWLNLKQREKKGVYAPHLWP